MERKAKCSKRCTVKLDKEALDAAIIAVESMGCVHFGAEIEAAIRAYLEVTHFATRNEAENEINARCIPYVRVEEVITQT